MRSWAVSFWDRVFIALSWVSLFRLVGVRVKFLRTPGGVEIWVLGHLVLAFAVAALTTTLPGSLATRILVAYGLVRIFEITVYQANVLLFDRLRSHRRGEQYALEGYTRIVLLLLANYFEIIFWFAAGYGVIVPEVGEVARTLPVLLTESFAVFTGFGTAHLDPENTRALSFVWAESAVGLFMSIIVLARFIGMLPAPRSRTPGESSDE